jgi:Tol biopolymer transport system component
MSDRDEPRFEPRIADWLMADPEIAPTQILETVASALPSIPQRRGVTLRSWPAPVGRALAVATVAGAMLVGAVGSSLFTDRPVDPSPLPSAFASGPAVPSTPAPSTASPAPAGLVAYRRLVHIRAGQPGCATRIGDCDFPRLWIANADGSDPRELLPGVSTQALGWTPDGSRLLIFDWDPDSRRARWAFTDVTGSVRQLVPLDCLAPCVDAYDPAISPDGGRIAFVHVLDTGLRAPRSVIAILDLATGTVTDLEATTTHVERFPRLGIPCSEGCDDGMVSAPSWSPDGGQLVFTRVGYLDAPPTGRPAAQKHALFIVDADGTDLRHLVPVDLAGVDARWSPDGTRIAFTSAVETLVINDVTGVRDMSHVESDVFTVRPDGSDLQRHTDDGQSHLASWTADGRLVVTRIPLDPGNNPTGWTLWVVDVGTGDEHRVVPVDIPTLSGLGCTACPVPESDPPDVSAWLPALAYWQPVGADRGP